MQNLKEAYGENYLSDPEISKSLRQRMGFSENEPLTESIIENKITGNIVRLKGELAKMAREEFRALFPKDPDKAAKAYADAVVDGKLNNDKFLQNLKAANIDITNGEDFDPTFAKEKMSPSLIEDLTRSVATTATSNQALIFSVKIKDEYYTQRLLKKGVNINAQDYSDKSALILAIENGSIATAKDLLTRGATVNNQDLLISAFEKGMTKAKDHKAVQELIEETIIKEGEQNSLNQAFLLSLKLNLNDYAKSLLERGADVNAKDKDGNTALMLASKNIMPDIVKTLIDKGAEVNGTNKNGQSALSIAVNTRATNSSAMHGNTTATIDLLLKQPQIDVSAQNNGNFPLVYWMAASNSSNYLYALIAKNADIDQPGPDGMYPLEFRSMFSNRLFSNYAKEAIDQNNFEAVDRLVKLNKRLCKNNPKRNQDILIDDQSLLKYAIDNQPDLARRMIEADFSFLPGELKNNQAIQNIKINNEPIFEYSIKNNKILAFNMIQDKVVSFSKEELKDNQAAQEILKNKNILQRIFKPFNKDDLVKIAILTPPPSQQYFITSSPLKVAMDTGQLDLAAKMIDSGYKLKKSELSREADIKNESLIKRIFGISSQTKLLDESRKYLEQKRQSQPIKPDQSTPPVTPDHSPRTSKEQSREQSIAN